ncbi:hypothetical protein PHYBLDRAFT_146160 [Phycomyces blakesleeanus NRRL 1555(-)]|uniref:SMP domain-containing protein n=1 Tax=Phycomyces blakesleeanus (strain ATCC 8743b / DSM 1359 / FGSC 10004 / NBRC 33097 / NRRL 1555) TaxID=763407 RepID=A0A163DQB0_PHYB8|nr:hypothetical protein PHYBLDRAFT_146160 [Phycomyces blakesleeanus NRRL 1555(-)]OAD72840.1 hypothetical protein PHYBLDRAFT_146160 [Phycomyces blakesleeanus NRRL 1555(-)]|eukprot:XP_018290880.1 hypothetical protein PHYBLDRAFT_146160 [Phycomyces blakesleeanus NRRL 1555(-)]
MSNNPHAQKSGGTHKSGGAKSQMTPKDAARIQSHSDRTGINQDFKSRAQSAADKNANK